jgi:dUTP pyrophosphatase
MEVAKHGWGLFFWDFRAIWLFFCPVLSMQIPFLDVELLKLDERVKLAYATDDSAAVDLPAILDGPLMLGPGECKRIGARFKMNVQVPEGMHVAAIVVPRSSWGSKGLVIANTVGLIDADYQGEVLLTLLNRDKDPLIINPGDRIMQMFFIPVLRARFTEVSVFSEVTGRGEGGFGSSGA